MADGSHVRVVARIRPLSKTELERKTTEAVTSMASLEPGVKKIEYKEVADPELLQVSVPDAPKRWFELDAVFDKNSTQDEVYIKCGAKNAVCNNIFKGFNCTILAYGQVGLYLHSQNVMLFPFLLLKSQSTPICSNAMRL